jgi:MFS family permease
MSCFAASFAIVSISTSLPMFLLAAIVGACGYGVCSSLIQAIVIEVTPRDSLGAGSNTSYAGLDLGNILGPVIGGFVVDVFRPVVQSDAQAYSIMWVVMIGFIALGFIVLMSQRGRLRRYAAEKAAADATSSR